MKTIYIKLLKVQKEVGAIKKDKENPFFKSNYADINNYIEEVKPILSKHELIILQPLIIRKGKDVLKTIIIDSETGEKIKSVVKLPDNLDPQKMGSAITYYRRYAIQSMLFLQAKDDDAEGVIVRDGKKFKDVSEPSKKVELPTIKKGEDVPF